MDTLPPYTQDGNLYTVYALIDPRSHAVRYVGITNNVYERFKQHIRCNGVNAGKDAWIQDLQSQQHMVIMQTLEQVETADQARIQERYWIRHYDRLGAVLLNADVVHAKLPPKPKFSAKIKVKSPQVTTQEENAGRRTSFVQMIEMLSKVHETHEWPGDISPQMQRYYKRTYPEFFHNGQKWARMRLEHQQKARRMQIERQQRKKYQGKP